MVMRGDSRPRVCGFESSTPDTGWTFFNYIVVKIVMFVGKDQK